MYILKATSLTHLSGILMAMQRSMAMARRLNMELWVSTRTKQAMNRQPQKLAQKPVLITIEKGMASTPTAMSATASETTKKLVMLWRLLLRPTAQQTNTLPRIESRAISSSRIMYNTTKSLLSMVRLLGRKDVASPQCPQLQLEEIKSPRPSVSLTRRLRRITECCVLKNVPDC